MKKVMIVDDEILIRETIRRCVDWEKEGFLYCGDASDGEVALPIIEEQRPDILITDIKMPFMDGLELASIVNKQMPEIKIIVMSGHDEFRYAQAAIRLGVEDYCLKPISASELISLLHKVSRKIDEEQQLKRSQGVTREKLLSDLCGGLIGTSEAIETAKKLSLSLTARFYAVTVLDIRCHESANAPDEADLKGIQSELDLLETPGVEGFTFVRGRTELVRILKSGSAESISEAIEQMGSLIRAKLEDRFGCEIAMGAGSLQERLQGIHVSYLEAQEDQHITRLTRQNRVSLREATYREKMDVLLDRAGFLDFLKIGTMGQRDAFVREFSQDLKQVDWRASLYGFYLLNDLTLEAFRTAKIWFRSSEDPADSIGRMQQALRKVSSWEDSCDYLKALLQQLWLWRIESSDKYGDTIEKVKSYIQEHYPNDQLSLKDIAAHVRVSPSHLSKIFSQEMGQTLTEYLTQVRIRRAMELLQSTPNKTFEIAFDVGYGDPHYFSNLFKRFTGMTPKEYRNQGTAELKAGRLEAFKDGS
ncbi:response regulator transcription factor [Cohnella sp. AR92]|uniref:response regulator transcription factor n=1 Tax=Cohnella sp. AR92 TaxID=648716 RepID=UPI000F8F1910|nr:response regulator transcription factor [Cohnella sp. AR92]RUS47917.1 response regulator transcription factor [Cohnella sp. AR92]